MTFLTGGGKDFRCYIKNKLNPEILNDKKKLQTKMFVTKNLNWQILTTNLVTFER